MTLQRWEAAYQNSLSASIYVVTTGLIVNAGIYIYVTCYLCCKKSVWNIPDFIFWQLAVCLVYTALIAGQLGYIMMTKENLMFDTLPFQAS